MREILDDVQNWIQEEKKIALAIVVNTWGSAPRGVGAKMAFTLEGDLSGSVSGGCVEGAVIEAGYEVIRSGAPDLLHFGVADETAWEVGLACGGSIEVFIQTLDPDLIGWVSEQILSDTTFALITVIDGPKDLLGSSLRFTIPERLLDELPGVSPGELVEIGAAAVIDDTPKITSVNIPDLGEIKLFCDVISMPPTLIMIGGVHISVALAKLAKAIGFRTVIIEPRKAFSQSERFPEVDSLLQAWPQEGLSRVGITEKTAIAVLTHDPKIDDEAMASALPSAAFYVGGLGSMKTQKERRKRLRELGLTPDDLSRLHGPIGLDLNAHTPEEIALSILAEIVMVQRGADRARVSAG